MANRVILYWRDIPAQIIIKQGRKKVKRILPARFEQAIDRAAMRGKVHDSDSYLEQWHRGPAHECSDALEDEADRLVMALEAEFTSEYLHQLVANAGYKRADYKTDEQS